MKATAITLPALLLPLQAQAKELVLNCQYETAWDSDKSQNSTSSGSFSATVILSERGDVAVIKATTWGCAIFEGWFSELSVTGECEKTISTSARTTIHSWLDIDRISGEFEHKVLLGTEPTKPASSFVWYYGHCKPGSKLF
jgi:hypothetical protein